MGLGKALKKAGNQLATNARHLAANVETAVVKEDLGPDRRKAREEIEKFEKDKALLEAMQANGTFDKAIAELTKKIDEVKARCAPLDAFVKEGGITTLEGQTEGLDDFLINIKAKIILAEPSLNQLKGVKASIKAAMDLAIAQFKILQGIPDAEMDKKARVEQGKAAAKTAIEQAQLVLKLFTEAGIQAKTKAVNDLLAQGMPDLINAEKMHGELKAVAAKEAATKVEAAAKQAEVAAKAAAAALLEAKGAKDKPDASLLAEFAALQEKMAALMGRLQASQNPQLPSVTPQFQAANAGSAGAGANSAPAAAATAAGAAAGSAKPAGK